MSGQRELSLGDLTTETMSTAHDIEHLRDMQVAEIARYHRDMCCQKMWDCDGDVTTAKWRRKCEAWESIRQAYMARAGEPAELDFLIV